MAEHCPLSDGAPLPWRELERLGMHPARCDVAPMRASHGHALYRVCCGGRVSVLKVCSASEVRNYALLEGLGVPTLTVHGRTECALLLEDLACSADWRLARETDVSDGQVGEALARWYRALHRAGRELLARPEGAADHLAREADALSAEVVWEIGRRLGMGDAPVWRAAAEAIESLRAAMRALLETLNYNDFFWTNLALSRGDGPLRAIVFDYHLLGIGPAYSDIRNVCGSLRGAGRDAFRAAYDAVDPREAVLDAPVATLYSLWVAVQRPSLPAWAEDGVRQAADGTLLGQVRRALALC